MLEVLLLGWSRVDLSGVEDDGGGRYEGREEDKEVAEVVAAGRLGSRDRGTPQAVPKAFELTPAGVAVLTTGEASDVHDDSV